MPPDFFQSYLNSICQHYAQWWQVYTLTDVVGQASTPRSLTLPIWDLGLRVQTIDRDKDPKTNESKTERFTVLEGLRKYAADHVLLVGRPGSGKSTALARLLIEEAQKAQQDSSAPIPILVELRYYQDSVLELMRSFLQTHGLMLDRSMIETLLFEGRFLLLVDGLNELPSEDARREVKVFEQTNRKTPMIFTTRDLGVGGDLNLTRKLEMQPLTEKQMQELCTIVPSYSRRYLTATVGRSTIARAWSDSAAVVDACVWCLQTIKTECRLIWVLCFGSLHNSMTASIQRGCACCREGSRAYWQKCCKCWHGK